MKGVYSGEGAAGRPVLLVLTEHDFDPEPDLERQKLTIHRYATCLEDMSVSDDTVVFLHTASDADLVHSFFLNELQEGFEINFLNVHSNIGPGGLLKLLPPGINGNVMLVNVADFRRELDISRLVSTHIESEAKLSFVTAMPIHERDKYEFVVDARDAVTRIRIAVGNQHRVSVGVYLISTELIHLISDGIHVSMTDLFLTARRAGQKVLAIESGSALSC